MATVRSTGQSSGIRLVAVSVRPRSGRPRSPASTHDIADSGMLMNERARVTVAASSSAASRTDRTAIHSVARTTVIAVSAIPTATQAMLHGLRLSFDAHSMSPAASRTTMKAASPMRLSGTVNDAKRPRSSAPMRSLWLGSQTRLGPELAEDNVGEGRRPRPGDGRR